MRTNLPFFRLLALGFIAAAAAAVLGARWQEKLVVMPQDGMLVYAQDSEEGALQGRDATQKIKKSDSGYVAEYGFRNFNDDQLTTRFEIAKDLYSGYEAEWGYKESDLVALKAAHEAARKQALADAMKKGKTQQQLNDALAMLKTQYEKNKKEYLSARGFRLLADGVVEVDMPELIRKHASRVVALSKLFDEISIARKYGGGDTIGAVTSMVQTAVMYKVPPNVVDGVHTGGLWPPEETLVKGWGDCDTKTGLLASILANFPGIKTIGLSLPDHYAMGVRRIPVKGDVFVEFEGQPYVLIEAAGPAWLPPGAISEGTQRLLESKEGYKVDVF